MESSRGSLVCRLYNESNCADETCMQNQKESNNMEPIRFHDNDNWSPTILHDRECNQNGPDVSTNFTDRRVCFLCFDVCRK